MADLTLPPNVKQDPNTGLYFITNPQGKTVRVNADTQQQLNQYVTAVNTGVPTTVTTTDPTTGNPRSQVFDSTAIIAETDSINRQRELLTAGKRQAGVIGNSDGSYYDLRNGKSISQEEAAAKISAAGLPPETLQAVTPKNSPAYAAAQQNIDQTTNSPSNIPSAVATQPEQAPSGLGNAPPSGSTLSPEYLQNVANGSVPRPLVTPDQAQAALQWQSDNGGPYRPNAVNPANEPQGFSQQYLEQAANPNRTGRFLISPEQAQAQLAQSTGAADPANDPLTPTPLTVESTSTTAGGDDPLAAAIINTEANAAQQNGELISTEVSSDDPLATAITNTEAEQQTVESTSTALSEEETAALFNDAPAPVADLVQAQDFGTDADPLAEQLALQQQEQAAIEEQALNDRLDTAGAVDFEQNEINQQQANELAQAYAPEPQPDPYSTTPLDQQAQDLTNAATAGAKSVNAGTNRAQNASTLQTRLNQPSAADWRVRLQLAPGATYLYKAQDAGILKPLAETDGVIFPYTPTISTSYNAKYDPYDLIHSNYRGYFYKSSQVETISIKGTFTAQDSREAAYLLAVIHFFRSVTKMFYGQDQEAGTPPPLVFLSGLGQYQFNNHSCVVSQFSYNLPNDVDYIRADGFNNIGLNMENRRNQSSGPAPGGSLGTVMSVINRLTNSGLKNGSLTNVPSPGQVNQNVTNQSAINSTYVPTKMEIDISLYPMQTRDQVSKLFSLKGYANGSLLQGGFW